MKSAAEAVLSDRAPGRKAHDDGRNSPNRRTHIRLDTLAAF